MRHLSPGVKNETQIYQALFARVRLFAFLELAISTHFTLIYRSITKPNVRSHHGLSKQPFSNSSRVHSDPQAMHSNPGIIDRTLQKTNKSRKRQRLCQNA